MKIFLHKLGFHKMDEMERSIVLRAQAYGFRFLAAALFLWSAWEAWVVRPNGALMDQRPCLLLICACFVQISVQLFLGRRAVSGDEEYRPPSLLRILAPLFFLTLLLAVVGAGMLAGRG